MNKYKKKMKRNEPTEPAKLNKHGVSGSGGIKFLVIGFFFMIAIVLWGVIVEYSYKTFTGKNTWIGQKFLRAYYKMSDSYCR